MTLLRFVVNGSMIFAVLKFNYAHFFNVNLWFILLITLYDLIRHSISNKKACLFNEVWKLFYDYFNL